MHSRRLIGFLSVSLGARALFAAAVFVNVFVFAPGFDFRQPSLRSGSVTTPDTAVRRNTENDSETVQNIAQSAELIASDGAAGAHLGFSVSISGDTVIVGVDSADNYKGAAYVYVRNGTAWNLQQKLTAADGAVDDNFGWTVAVSGDTALVGAYDINGTDAGAAYVFVRTGTQWTQQQKLTASDGNTNDQFGESVTVSGTTAVVGASGNNNFKGAAYVFTSNGGVWTEQQKLVASDGAPDDEFGQSVSVDGDTVAVGAYRSNGARGSAYIFVRGGTAWAQQQKLSPSDGAPLDQFGYSLSVSGDAVVVGAVSANSGGTSRGAAYVFSRSGSAWTQQQRLAAPDAADNQKFGGSVAVSGPTAVIGAEGDNVGQNTGQGSAYMFLRSGTAWTPLQKLTSSDGAAGDKFGGSVAIVPGAIAVGGYLHEVGSNIDQGAAYIFSEVSQTTPTPTPTATPIPTITPTPTPTPAQSATVSGKVVSPTGGGVRSATVTITDPAGNKRTVLTSSFGFYSFEGVGTGQSYSISVKSKRFRFVTQTVQVNSDTSNVDFLGLE